MACQPNTSTADWERLKIQDDLETQFSELVDGSMRTSFELDFDGHDLYGRDGRSLTDVTRNALIDAKRMVSCYPELWFEVRRRSIEAEEIPLALMMAKSEIPNTMIIVSDFPAELADAQEDVGGYNVTRQQTMLRVLVRCPNGNIQLYSQTLDGTDRKALEAIYEYFGIQPETGELLGQRIHADIPPEDHAFLVDRLTGAYDRSLTASRGGNWYAGRRPVDYRNTYDFVRQQQDIIQTCVDLRLEGLLNDQVMYDMSAAMRFRFNNPKQEIFDILMRQTVLDPTALQLEAMRAGQEAREDGQSFSACGITLKPNGIDGSSEAQLSESGYGNKSGKDDDCEFISKKCPMCGTKNVKTKVTKTHISGSCGCSKKK